MGCQDSSWAQVELLKTTEKPIAGHRMERLHWRVLSLGSEAPRDRWLPARFVGPVGVEWGMSMTHSEACEILRKQAVVHHGKFIQGVWLILFFVFAIALVGITDGMPLGEAGLACGVLRIIGRRSVVARHRALGWMFRLKWNGGFTIRSCCSLMTVKRSMMERTRCPIGVSTGGTVHWRLRFHLAEGGWVSISMSQKERKISASHETGISGSKAATHFQRKAALVAIEMLR